MYINFVNVVIRNIYILESFILRRISILCCFDSNLWLLHRVPFDSAVNEILISYTLFSFHATSRQRKQNTDKGRHVLVGREIRYGLTSVKMILLLPHNYWILAQHYSIFRRSRNQNYLQTGDITWFDALMLTFVESKFPPTVSLEKCLRLMQILLW